MKGKRSERCCRKAHYPHEKNIVHDAENSVASGPANADDHRHIEGPERVGERQYDEESGGDREDVFVDVEKER